MIVNPLSNVIKFDFTDDISEYENYDPYNPKGHNIIVLKKTKRYLSKSLNQIELVKDSILTSEQIGMYVPTQTLDLRTKVKLSQN